MYLIHLFYFNLIYFINNLIQPLLFILVNNLMILPSLILAFQAKIKDNQGFNGGLKRKYQLE